MAIALFVILTGDLNSIFYSLFGISRLFTAVSLILVVLTFLTVRLPDRLNPPLFLKFILMFFLYLGFVGSLFGIFQAGFNIWPMLEAQISACIVVITSYLASLTVIKMSRERLNILKLIIVCSTGLVTLLPVICFIFDWNPVISFEQEKESAVAYSGLLGNPNMTANYALLFLCFTCTLNLNFLWRLCIFAFVGIAVFITISRGGIILYLIILSVFGLLSKTKTFIFCLALSCILAVSVLYYSDDFIKNTSFNHEFSYKISSLRNIISGESGFEDNSRGELATISFSAIAKRPIFGTGFGKQYYDIFNGFGAHNMYSHIAVLAGLPALFLYLTTLSCLLWQAITQKQNQYRLFSVLIGVWFLIGGLYSHNLLDDKPALCALGLVAAFMSTGQVHDSDRYPTTEPPLMRFRRL